MFRELTLTLEFPYLHARYENDAVTAPLPLALEDSLMLQMLDDLDRYLPAARDRLLVLFGQQLFDAIIPAEVQPLYQRALREQRLTARAALRIRIVASDLQLLTLPWELLYDAPQAVFLSTAFETTIVRTVARVQPGEVLSPVSPLRLMLVGASPGDEPPLNYRPELEAILEASGLVRAEVQTLEHATAPRLREGLRDFRPHIIHFMGHGYCEDAEVGIRLEDRHGRTHLVSAAQLADWLWPAEPRLVILNACESGRLHLAERRGSLAAILLARGIPAVVAMQHRIPDQAGVVFGKALFEALCQGTPLEQAVQAGRYALQLEGGRVQRHFATPVLYLAMGSGGQLFSTPGKNAPAQKVRMRNPFLYLNSFTQDERALFFGRFKAIEALVSRIAAHRMLVVHGRTGVGKTSLLQAGLARSTAVRLYLPIRLRFLKNPLEALDEVIERELKAVPDVPDVASNPGAFFPDSSATPQAGGDAKTASLILRLQTLQVRSGRTLLLVLDQFEELFTLSSPPVRQRFLEVLHALYLEPALKLRIVLVIREDFFGALDPMRDRFPTIFANTYFLAPLTFEEALDALIGPLRYMAVPYDPGLIEQLLRDLWQDSVDPASLQIVGYNLYELSRARNEPGLSLAIYREVGGATGILSSYLTTFLGRYSKLEQERLHLLLEQFVTSQQTRKPATVAELCAVLREPPAVVWEVLEQLARARLVRRIDQVGEALNTASSLTDRWELVHEVLIDAIARPGSRREVWLLRHRIRLYAAANLLLILGMLLGMEFMSDPVALGVHLETEQLAAWEMTLIRGQEACGGQTARDAPRRFLGRGTSVFFLPVGTYEVMLKASDQPEIRFPIDVRPLRWHSISIRPPLRIGDLELIHIPGGDVVLGERTEQRGPLENVLSRRIRLEPFYISRFEMTRALYRQFLESSDPPYVTPGQPGTGCRQRDEASRLEQTPTSWEGPGEAQRYMPGDVVTVGRLEQLAPADLKRLPVTNVSHQDARAFVRWLSDQTGHRFRLPTEDEWELASRGTDFRPFAWGSCFPHANDWANVAAGEVASDPYPLMAPVGSFPWDRSPFGVMDLVGNVRELAERCLEDARADKGERSLRCSDAKAGMSRTRGGSFRRGGFEVRASSWDVIGPDECSNDVGFRVVMEVPEQEAHSLTVRGETGGFWRGARPKAEGVR